MGLEQEQKQKRFQPSKQGLKGKRKGYKVELERDGNGVSL